MVLVILCYFFLSNISTLNSVYIVVKAEHIRYRSLCRFQVVINIFHYKYQFLARYPFASVPLKFTCTAPTFSYLLSGTGICSNTRGSCPQRKVQCPTCLRKVHLTSTSYQRLTTFTRPVSTTQGAFHSCFYSRWESSQLSSLSSYTRGGNDLGPDL